MLSSREVEEAQDEELRAAIERFMGGSNEADPPPPKSLLPGLTVDVSDPPTEACGSSSIATPNSGSNSSGHAPTNIFIAGIPSSWDEQKLRDRFSPYGEVVSVKLVIDRHFAFVMYRKCSDAQAAIAATHLQPADLQAPKGGFLHVSVAMHDEGVDDVPNPRLFIRGLPQETTKEALLKTFERFGKITDTNLLMTSENLCKGVAFISYSCTEEATAAIEACQRPIQIKQHEVSLIVKYSETQEVRRQRNERNKMRQHQLNSTTAVNPKSPANAQPPNLTPMGTSAAQTPHSAARFPSTQPGPPPPPPPPPTPPPAYPGTPAPSNAAQPFNLVNPYAAPPTPVHQALQHPPPFPGPGDFFLSSSVPLTKQVVQALLSPSGLVNEVLITAGGAVVRMADRSVHAAIVKQLGGGAVVPYTGQVVYAALVV